MKCLISIFILFNSVFLDNSFATQIKLRFEDGMEKDIEIVSKIFQNKYNIPKQLITLEKGKCKNQKQNNIYLLLCLNKKRELQELSSNLALKIKSLRAFSTLQNSLEEERTK